MIYVKEHVFAGHFFHKCVIFFLRYVDFACQANENKFFSV